MSTARCCALWGRVGLRRRAGAVGGAAAGGRRGLVRVQLAAALLRVNKGFRPRAGAVGGAAAGGRRGLVRVQLAAAPRHLRGLLRYPQRHVQAKERAAPHAGRAGARRRPLICTHVWPGCAWPCSAISCPASCSCLSRKEERHALLGRRCDVPWACTQWRVMRLCIQSSKERAATGSLGCRATHG